MRNIIAVAALALLLGACGGAEPETEAFITVTTTEIVTTTEEPTTQFEETTQQAIREVTRELALSDMITVFVLNWRNIWMRDETTDVETPLLEKYADEWEQPIVYSLGERLNERYFTFHKAIEDTCAISTVMFYDIERQREIRPQSTLHEDRLDFYRVEDGRVYLTEAHGMRDTPDYFALFYVEFTQLDSGEPVVVNDAGRISQEEWWTWRDSLDT